MLSLGAHSGRILPGMSNANVVLSPFINVQQRNTLKELSRLQIMKKRFARKSFVPTGRSTKPVVAKVETVCGVSRGDEFKHRKRHASGIHFLEHKTDRLP